MEYEAPLTAAGNSILAGTSWVTAAVIVFRFRAWRDRYAQMFLLGSAIIAIAVGARTGWYMVANWLRTEGHMHHPWMLAQREWIALIAGLAVIVGMVYVIKGLMREDDRTRVWIFWGTAWAIMAGAIGFLGALYPPPLKQGSPPRVSGRPVAGRGLVLTTTDPRGAGSD